MRRGPHDEDLVAIDVLLEGPCIFIRLEPERGSWPFLLRNDSDERIQVCQAVSLSR